MVNWNSWNEVDWEASPDDEMDSLRWQIWQNIRSMINLLQEQPSNIEAMGTLLTCVAGLVVENSRILRKLEIRSDENE